MLYSGIVTFNIGNDNFSSAPVSFNVTDNVTDNLQHLVCGPGRYVSQDTTCYGCSPGTYSSTNNATFCNKCPVGSNSGGLASNCTSNNTTDTIDTTDTTDTTDITSQPTSSSTKMYVNVLFFVSFITMVLLL